MLIFLIFAFKTVSSLSAKQLQIEKKYSASTSSSSSTISRAKPTESNLHVLQTVGGEENEAFGRSPLELNYYFSDKSKSNILLANNKSFEFDPEFRKNLLKILVMEDSKEKCEVFQGYLMGYMEIDGQSFYQSKKIVEVKKYVVSRKPSTMDQFTDSIKDLKKAKKPDKIYISLNDHGIESKNKECGFIISLAYEKGVSQKICSRALKKDLLDIIKKGVGVQLHFSACYSGGFNKEIFDLAKKDKNYRICSISTSQSDSLAAGDGPVFRTHDTYYSESLTKYNNMLEAHYCAFFRDQINKPDSSLDWLIKSKIGYNKSTKCNKNLIIKNDINQIATITLRKKILNFFDKKIGSKINDCAKSYSPDHQVDAFYNNLVDTCVENNLFTNPHINARFKKYFNSKKNSAYNSDYISRHIDFIENANLEQLKLYQSQLCCLGYNFKTKKESEICK